MTRVRFDNSLISFTKICQGAPLEKAGYVLHCYSLDDAGVLA